MPRNQFRLAVCLLILFSLLAGLTSAALAAPNLEWQTEQVYYDQQDRLIIEGYFVNSGTNTITWVNWQKMSVYFRQKNTAWCLQAAGIFRDINITLDPGDSIHWKFRITNVEYVSFDYWDVKWNVNYNYLKKGYDL